MPRSGQNELENALTPQKNVLLYGPFLFTSVPKKNASQPTESGGRLLQQSCFHPRRFMEPAPCRAPGQMRKPPANESIKTIASKEYCVVWPIKKAARPSAPCKSVIILDSCCLLGVTFRIHCTTPSQFILCVISPWSVSHSHWS